MATVRAIEGVLRGADVPHEILVVLDHCTDDTEPALRQLMAEMPALRISTNEGPGGYGFAVRHGLDVYYGRRRGGGDGRRVGRSARHRDLLSQAAGRLRLRLRFAIHRRRGGAELPVAEAPDEPRGQPRHPPAVPRAVQRLHQRLQVLPARGDRRVPSAALEPLQPDHRAAAEGGRARLLVDGGARRTGTGARPASRSSSSRRWGAGTCTSSSTR